MIDELKPCPFCGMQPLISDLPESAIHVACKCGVSMFGGKNHHSSHKEASDRWNTRAPQWQPIETAYAIALASAARASLPFIAYAFDQGIEGAEEAGRAIEAALEVKSQWQPISTAPKDGTFYLATNGKDLRIENCPEGRVAGIWHRIDGDWRGSALGDDSTHWQPLPAPPEVK